MASGIFSVVRAMSGRSRLASCMESVSTADDMDLLIRVRKPQHRKSWKSQLAEKHVKYIISCLCLCILVRCALVWLQECMCI